MGDIYNTKFIEIYDLLAGKFDAQESCYLLCELDFTYTNTDEFIFYAFKINLIFGLSMLHCVILKDIIAFGLELYLLVSYHNL